MIESYAVRDAASHGSAASPDHAAFLAAQFCSGLALVVLMIGQFLPDLRLTFDGFPLNTFLLVQTALFSLALPLPAQVRHHIAIVIGLVMTLAVSLLWSRDAGWGASTLLDLTASAATASLLLAYSIERIGVDRTFRVWLGLLAALLMAAVAFKVQFGFFDRQVNFLLNGPNVFARQMGLAALLSAFLLRGPLRWLAIATFTLAVVWTQSKGPLLFLLLVGFAIGWLRLGGKGRILALLAMGGVVFLIGLFVDELREIQLFQRVFVAVAVFDAGLGGENYASVGSRVQLYSTAAKMLAEYPFGIGLGSWMSATGLFWAEYPHNFFLEILLEGGLILGAIAGMAFFAFLLSRSATIVVVGAFLALCQQVSGGLGDARFWLAFACIGAVTSRWSLHPDSRRDITYP